jgi:hypothetical protein
MKILNRICLIAITIAALSITALSLFGIRTMIAFTAWLVEPGSATDFSNMMGGF